MGEQLEYIKYFRETLPLDKRNLFENYHKQLIFECIRVTIPDIKDQLKYEVEQYIQKNKCDKNIDQNEIYFKFMIEIENEVIETLKGYIINEKYYDIIHFLFIEQQSLQKKSQNDLFNLLTKINQLQEDQQQYQDQVNQEKDLEQQLELNQQLQYTLQQRQQLKLQIKQLQTYPQFSIEKQKQIFDSQQNIQQYGNSLKSLEDFVQNNQQDDKLKYLLEQEQQILQTQYEAQRIIFYQDENQNNIQFNQITLIILRIIFRILALNYIGSFKIWIHRTFYIIIFSQILFQYENENIQNKITLVSYIYIQNKIIQISKCLKLFQYEYYY